MQAGAWTHISSAWDAMRRYNRPPWLQGCHLLGMSCRTLGHVYYCTQDSLHEMPSVATPGLHDFKGVIYWLCHVEYWDTWVIYRTLLQTGFRVSCRPRDLKWPRKCSFTSFQSLLLHEILFIAAKEYGSWCVGYKSHFLMRSVLKVQVVAKFLWQITG